MNNPITPAKKLLIELNKIRYSQVLEDDCNLSYEERDKRNYEYVQKQAALIDNYAKEYSVKLTDKIKELESALEPIRCAGDGSGPEFAPYFEDAAKSPIYWTEMVIMGNDRVKSLEEHNKKLTDLLHQWINESNNGFFNGSHYKLVAQSVELIKTT